MDADGIERRFRQRRQAGVGLVLGVAHVAVVAVAALGEFAVDAVAGVGIEALQGLPQPLRIDADGAGQGFRCVGAVQVAGLDQRRVVHRLRPRQAQAVTVQRFGVADQPDR
ncbi:hypothetical protein D3C78_1459530 [compost metagenome]